MPEPHAASPNRTRQRPRRRGDVMWWQFLLVGSVACAAAMLTAGSAAAAGCAVAVDVAAIAAQIVGVRRHRPAHRTPWYLLTVGLGLFTAGHLVWGTFEGASPNARSFAASDVLYLAAYGVVAVAAFRTLRSQWNRSTVLDAATIALGIIAALSSLAIEPLLDFARRSDGSVAVAVLYPAADAAIIAALAHWVLRPGRMSAAMRLQFVALGALLVGDSVANVATAVGTDRFEWLVLGCWTMAAVAASAAALHPSMARSAANGGGIDTGKARAFALSLCILCAPAVIAFETVLRGAPSSVALVVSLLLATVVALRVQDLVATMSAAAALDPLTGLRNRGAFNAELSTMLRELYGSDDAVALVCLDLDDFKLVNDTLGHGHGDDLLVEVSRRLVGIIPPGWIAGRLGGDEFVLAGRVASPVEAEAVAAAAVATGHTPIVLPTGAELHTRLSAGVTTTYDAAAHPGELLSEADAALYEAKALGRSRVHVFDSALVDRAATRLSVESELRAAIANGDLRLHYQAEIDLRTGRLAGAEALVRWQHPTRGLLAPSAFVPIADMSDLIGDVGTWALDEACRQMRRWVEAHGDAAPSFVGVNVAVRQLLTPGFVEEVAAVLRRHRLDPPRLMIEVTETGIASKQAVASAVARLRDIGVRIAVDDFGTGHSSLQRLHSLSLDVIKIDRSFVAGVGASAEGRAVVAAIVHLAQSVGSLTIAEGVETQAEHAYLASVGCDIAQGYFYAHPMTAEEFEATLRAGDALAR